MTRSRPRMPAVTPFAVLSLLLVLTLGTGIGVFVAAQMRSRAVAHAQELAAAVADLGVRPLLTPADLAGGPLPPARARELDRALAPVLARAQVRHLKMYDARGVQVWSDEGPVRGTGHGGDDVLTALAGRSVGELTELGDGSRAVEAYVPIRLDGASAPGGVFEIYLDHTLVDDAVRRDTTVLAGVLAVALLLLWALVARLAAVVNRVLRRSFAEQERLAHTDALTGLPNRLAFEKALARACRREGQPVGVLLLDVDRFREVNDSFGHRAGDELLRVVADRLREAAGPGVFVTRLGGDEFAAVLEGNSRRTRTSEVLEAMSGAALLLGGSRIDIAASAGLATGVGGEVDAETLLQRADVAMYAAKRRGGDLLAEWEPAMGRRAVERLEMLSDLRTAVAEEEMQVYVQPAIDLRTDRVAGVEVLLRWNHPEHGLLGPDSFVPLAEQCDIISTLTSWTLDRSVAAGAAWQEAGRDLTVAVNISPRNLTPALPGQVAAALGRHGLEPSRLTIELTETCLPSSMETAADVLADIAALGVRIAVDDFGTGFATLAWLRRLSFTQLKIDRTFVGDLLREPGAVELVRHVIALGHGLGMEVTAEGVETAGQEALLRDLGCDLVQGFRHAAPMPLEAFGRWLAQREGRPAVAAAP